MLSAAFSDIAEEDMLASYRRLTGEGLARNVVDSAKPGALLLRLTDIGMARADELLEAERKPTWKDRLSSIPIGKGLWDVFKIGLGFILGLLTHNITGN